MEPREPKPNPHALNLQQRVLIQGMLHSQPDLTIQYANKGNARTHDVQLTQQDVDEVTRRFKRSPKDMLGIGRQNILNIMKDTKLPAGDKGERSQRYTDAYLDLILKLDHAAFAPTPAGQVLSGIPPYIPDGLTDMGQDPTIDPSKRTREALIVNKAELFKLSRTFLYDMFKTESQHALDSDQLKRYLIQKTAAFVYTQIPYDYENLAGNLRGNVPLDQVVRDQSGVCRHQALYTQVLLEVLGITSRLSKSDFYEQGKFLGPHVNNLVRVNNKWHILDSTNPDKKNGKNVVFLKPLPEKDIDPNNEHFWTFQLNNGTTRSYKTRKNMYYRIQKAA